MGICDKCKRLCPSTKMPQGDDPLCDECETMRVATLVREQQHRKLWSFSMRTTDETSTMNNESAQAATAELPCGAQPSVDPNATHSETPPESGIEDVHSETPPIQPPDVYCIDHCRHGRSGDGDMIRCCMCFRWHHEQCVADGSIRQDTPGWLCPPCRSLPDTVRVMSETIRSLQKSMDAMLATNNTLVKSVKDLTVKNEQLLAQISSSNDRSKPLPNSNVNVPNLLIGASTIRDIASTDPSALYIISWGGAKTGDVLKTLKDTNTDAYADVTIHVGTNDCATKFPVDKIADNIREISNHAKRFSRSGWVTFSSITPRIDNVAAAEKSDTLNEQMQAIAKETGCLFVNNQDNFLCRNGDLNEELLSIDGLHLSKLGTERLISNLKLSKTACCHIGRTQRPGGEPQRQRWSADHARSGPMKGVSQRPRFEGISGSFPPPAAPVSSRTGRPLYVNRRPWQSRDKAWPPPQQQNSRHYKTETLASEGNHFEGTNNVNVPYCTFCGETNHRSYVCRFGMPVNCFRCHRQGHKKSFVNTTLDGPAKKGAIEKLLCLN